MESRIITVALAALLPLFAGTRVAAQAINDTTKYKALDGIQKNVADNLELCYATQKGEALTDLFEGLEKMTPRDNLITYWLAYTDFHRALFFMDSNELESCEVRMTEGIKLLEDQAEEKTSEDYALLAMMQSYLALSKEEVDWKEKLSATAERNALKAIEVDATNLRGYYVLANMALRAPQNSPLRLNTEKYLKKALALSVEEIAKPNVRPTWGRDHAYALLIRLYLNEQRNDEARALLADAIKAFPKSQELVLFQEKLENR